MRKLRGKGVKFTHELADSLAQLESKSPEFKREVADFIDDLVSHYVVGDGRLVVAQAGMKEAMQGRGSGAVRSFAFFGETTGETDDYGLPVRYNWAAESPRKGDSGIWSHARPRIGMAQPDHKC
jgi:protein phosphatase